MGALKENRQKKVKMYAINGGANVKTKAAENPLVTAIYRSNAVIEFDLDENILNANEKFLKLFGYERDDLRNHTHSFLCEADGSQSSSSKEMWAKLRRGESDSGEYKRIGKNGREIWIVASYCPVLDSHGKPVRVVMFANDITESKAELKVRTEIMNLTSIVSEANLRGDIVSANDKYCEVSKYSLTELLGKPHNLTRHPDMPKEVFRQMWATIGSGKMFRGVVKNRAKDGTPYYVDAVIAPIMGDNGKPKKYLGVRYDLTAIETERQNMRGIIRAIDATFNYCEFDVNGTVLTCNKNFQSLLGYSETEVAGKTFKLFGDPVFCNSNEYLHFWEDLRSGKSKSGLYKNVTHGGREVWLQAVFSPVTDEVGRVIKIVQVSTDVTDQQNMIVSIQETANTLASASSELTATATELSGTANKTSKDSELAASAAERVAVGVQTVATNMEEMVASIKEIGRSTSESAQMAKTTLQKAQESNRIVTKLGVSSQEIGAVIKVISSIAQQTNLLALNATIEAARAGEAGKGFAVVANEVKELAKQTAKATDEITTKIGAIQSDTRSAVEAIGGISLAVEKLNGLSGVVATAVEEQTATTNEISRVVVESKRGVESIAGTVKAVSSAALANSTSSQQTLTASRELAQLAEKLSALVRRVES